MDQRNGINPTRPLARGRRTSQARTIQAAIKPWRFGSCYFSLLRIVGGENQPLWVVLAPAELQNHCRLSGNLQVPGHIREFLSVIGSRATSRGSNWAFHQTSTCHDCAGHHEGSGMVRREIQEEAKQTFEAALAIATRRRKARPRTPPMAYVVEEIPEGGIPESIPEHLLFTVPENWHPPSDFGQGRQPSSVGEKQLPKLTAPKRPTPPAISKRRDPLIVQKATRDNPPGA
jgi:hypothetical protein